MKSIYRRALIGALIGSTLVLSGLTRPALAQTSTPAPPPPGENVSAGAGASALRSLKLLPDCLTSSKIDSAGKTPIQEAGISCITETITHATNLLLVVIAIGAFFYLLYGAFLYTTAFGDEAKIKTAKGAIKYALIAVIIASLSIAVVRLLFDVLKVQA